MNTGELFTVHKVIDMVEEKDNLDLFWVKMNRRRALSTAGKAGVAAVVAAIVAGAGGYFVGGGGVEKTVTVTGAEKTVTKTVEKTVTSIAETTATSATTVTSEVTAPSADVVLQRAIEGIRSLMAAGKLPSGTKVIIACEEGFQENAVSHAVDAFYEVAPFTRDDFDVVVIGIPFVNLYEKFSSEAVSKSGAYDITWGVVTWFFPDLVESGLIRPIGEYINKYDPDSQMRNSFLGTLKEYQTKAKGEYYSLASDGDVFLLHYRKDVIDHSEEKDNFKSQYGYELRPPRTWDQFMDMAEFFTRKAGDRLAGQTLETEFSGVVEWRLKFVTYEWVFCRLCTLRDDPTRVYLDPDTLEPLLNQDDTVSILEYMKNLHQFMPEGSLSWAYGENLAHFSNGNAFMWVTWPNGGKLPQFPERSKIVGKVASSTHPIWKYERYYMASGYNAGVSNYSKNPELAYLVNQALHSPTLSFKLVSIAESNVDPFEIQHFADPNLLGGKWEDFDWDPVGSKTYLEALRTSLLKGFPELAIPGYPKFTEAFETNLALYFAGDISAEKAVSDTAKRWTDIIDSIGKDRIREYYSALIKVMPP